jgi:hypothetical protein
MVFIFSSTLPFAVGQVQDVGLIFLSAMASSIAARCLDEVRNCGFDNDNNVSNNYMFPVQRLGVHRDDLMTAVLPHAIEQNVMFSPGLSLSCWLWPLRNF